MPFSSGVGPATACQEAFAGCGEVKLDVILRRILLIVCLKRMYGRYETILWSGSWCGIFSVRLLLSKVILISMRIMTTCMHPVLAYASRTGISWVWFFSLYIGVCIQCFQITTRYCFKKVLFHSSTEYLIAITDVLWCLEGSKKCRQVERNCYARYNAFN